MKIGIIYENLLKENTFFHGSPHSFDRFDMSKIGTGDEKQKYGYGLYFTDSFKTAAQYAKDLTLNHHTDGLNVYEVKLLETSSYVDWDEPAYQAFECACKLLMKLGKDDTVEEMREETSEDNGYEMWTFGTLYEMMSHYLGSAENATKAFYKHCGITGVVARNAWLDGNIYVAFSDEVIKMLDRKKIK